DRGDGNDGVAAEILEVLHADYAGLGQQRQQHGQLEHDAEPQDQRHDEGEVLAHARLQVDLDLAAGLLHRQEKLHGQRHDDEKHHQRTEDEQNEGPQQVGAERLALVLVEAGGYKFVDLVGDQRKGEEHGTKQGKLQLGEEELVRSRIDHLDLLALTPRPHVGQDQQIVDVGGKGKADDEPDADAHQRVDHALAQLDQVVHQRRFGRLDLVVTLAIDGFLHRSASPLLAFPLPALS